VAKYFAPAFEVKVNGSRLKADVSKNIEQVQVVSKPDTIDTFSLTIANPLPELQWTHTADADLFKEGNAVTIKLGYADEALQEMISGEITHIQPTFPDSGVPTVTIEGQSLLHRLLGDSQTRTFQNKTDRQIAEQIGQEAGLTVEADDTGSPLDYVIQANKTDLDFLKERASKLHFEILVKDKTLIFRKAKEASKKVYTLFWAQSQKSFASGSTALPLKSFSPQINTKKPANKVEYRSYDHKTKQAFVVSACVQDQASKMGGTRSGAEVAAAAFQKERKQVFVTVPFASEAEGQQMAIASYNDSAMEFVTGKVETIGIPDLRSGCVVELQGVGSRFNGEYYLDEVTHSIAGGGYQTSLSVKRNGTS
jgi:phage protein D